MEKTENYRSIKDKIKPLNKAAMEKALQRQNSLIKPIGSLGKLEDIGVQFAGITGEVHNKIDKKILFLFGADNGIFEEGVSGTPQHYTNLLMSWYGANKGCGITVICAHNHVDLKLIDIGIIGDIDYTNIDNRRLMEGTNNFAKGPAIPPKTVEEAIDMGIAYALQAKEEGYQIIGTGEVGMGNTTTAAACIMAALGVDDPDLAVGKGGGLTDDMLVTKKQVITKALALHKPEKDNAVDIISKVGGLDIAAMVGVFLGAAYCKIPAVVDGIISIAAALLATKLNQNVKHYLFASHISKEPGYQIAADALGLSSFLNLDMRLGEGTGCPMAMGIIENALAVMNNMSTFEDVNTDGTYRIKM